MRMHSQSVQSLFSVPTIFLEKGNGFLNNLFFLSFSAFISPIIGLWALWEKNELELAIWSPFYRHWLNNRPIIIHVNVVNDIFNTEN